MYIPKSLKSRADGGLTRDRCICVVYVSPLKDKLSRVYCFVNYFPTSLALTPRRNGQSQVPRLRGR